MKQITITILSILICVVGITQTTTFTGAVNDLWREPGNWTNGVPDAIKTAVIPSGHEVWVAGDITAGGISNSGEISFTTGVDVNTNSINNNGTIRGYNNRITGIDDHKISFNNSGTIISGTTDGSVISISNASTFSNSGEINIAQLWLNGADNFFNQEGGKITTSIFHLNVNNFWNNSEINSNGMMYVDSQYAYNNGEITSGNADVYIASSKDYCREGSKSNMTAPNGQILTTGKKGDFKGNITAGTLSKSTNTDPSAGLVNIAIDSCWVHGDSAKIEAETIRFIFKLLDFIAIDSIMDIYANSKIEFWGTAGSMLSVIGMVAEDFIYVENGDIEIHVDSIRLFDHDIDYYCYPDPIVGPADTTFIQAFIGSAYISDSANSSGSFKINTRNNSTGNRSFDYTISSQHGWVNTTTGTAQLLAPFQFDSLMIDYNIPFDGDTLTDTVMVIFSIPGEYSDTAYSYIHSYPGLTVGVENHFKKTVGIELEVYPNPFINKLSIKTNTDAIIRIYDINGRMVEELNAEVNKEAYWFPESTIRKGIYLIKAGSEEGSNSKLIILGK